MGSWGRWKSRGRRRMLEFRDETKERAGLKGKANTDGCAGWCERKRKHRKLRFVCLVLPSWSLKCHAELQVNNFYIKNINTFLSKLTEFSTNCDFREHLNKKIYFSKQTSILMISPKSIKMNFIKCRLPLGASSFALQLLRFNKSFG